MPQKDFIQYIPLPVLLVLKLSPVSMNTSFGFRQVRMIALVFLFRSVSILKGGELLLLVLCRNREITESFLLIEQEQLYPR